MFRIKLEDFQNSVENETYLVLVDGKTVHLDWDRRVCWPKMFKD